MLARRLGAGRDDVLLCGAGSLLYTGGMFLNDFCDVISIANTNLTGRSSPAR